MKHCHFYVVVGIIFFGAVCASSTAGDLPRCDPSPSTVPLEIEYAAGVSIAVPEDSEGPSYEDDDWFQSRPTWRGSNWYIHFVFGNGGLTEFMEQSRCCSLNDHEMRRKVCIGDYIRYGAMADIARLEFPDKVTSVQVSIEPGGLSEEDALAILLSTVTTWEEGE